MTRVTSRSEPPFQSVRVRLRIASTHIIWFSSGLLFAILKNTVRIRLRFDKNSVKPVYKTPFRVRFDSLVCGIEVKIKCDMGGNFNSGGLQMFFGLSVVITEQYVHSAVKMSLAYLKH